MLGKKVEDVSTGRERTALKAEERAPERAETFFRAPAGSLASILELSTSWSSSTRIFEREQVLQRHFWSRPAVRENPDPPSDKSEPVLL